MPKRDDIESILILGAGPIVIGQACEFDYSGTQACRVLKKEGYRIILVNSNPATIMTDPEMADATYIEPVQWETVAEIIAIEKPSALLPTMGGQTALNCALDLVREGVLKAHHVELIGASREAIDKAEDRELFRDAMRSIGLAVPKSGLAHNMEDAFAILEDIGFPAVIRPSFTMGGSGGGIAYNREEFIEICERGLYLSPTHELLIDESLLGWKEFEMEVVRDRKDNCIIVCSIENLDPMGIHTGDSITVAPAQTLTDKEYQAMRNAAIAVIKEIGVDTGGSNVQFAVNPRDGRLVVIEMNPRVSRSSALASKATGFPIAKIAAKLAVGYTLDELSNEITGNQTPASFEPAIDYVVTKIPRFNFEKFPQADPYLTTQMKSVGEVMAIGRTFQESLQKALRALETGVDGLNEKYSLLQAETIEKLRHELQKPTSERLWYLADAFRAGLSVSEAHRLTSIDPWFLMQIADLVSTEKELKGRRLEELSEREFRLLKKQGFSDSRLGKLLNVDEAHVRKRRHQLGIKPVYKRVDTCAAEFSTSTAYLYSTYEEECEANPTNRKKIVVLGSGPNRIGQGIEFDYCCVHATMAMREEGYEAIMLNCNPETVSTDYDISDRLYFEPLTLEDVLEVIAVEKPVGVVVQYGGQTPLKLAKALYEEGITIIGTSPNAIDQAEDRKKFQQLVNKLRLKQPINRTISSMEEGLSSLNELAYPLIVRPSYVLGGRAMEIVYNSEECRRYLHNAVDISPKQPLLLDQFLEDAIEVDVDAICDGQSVLIGGILEHIEQAGIHSGDSSCSLPTYSLSKIVQDKLRDQVTKLALELNVIGLMNAQFAVKNGDVYVLEVNPRAARTIPFTSKAIGLPLAKIAMRCMLGISLAKQGYYEERIPSYYSIKQSVFPFDKFPGVDPILGPEMKSTGEVMGIGEDFGEAFAKGQIGINERLPQRGIAFISVRDADKLRVVELAKLVKQVGFEIVATRGTLKVLQEEGIPCQFVNKVIEGRPHIVDMIKNDEIDFIVNTTEGEQAIADSFSIRRSAVQHKVSYNTTIAGGMAMCFALQHRRDYKVRRLQDLHKRFHKKNQVKV